MEKHCNKCNTTKPVEEFHWRDKKKGKRYSVCKTCKNEATRKKYNQDTEYAELRRQQMKEYQQDNAEKLNQYNKEYIKKRMEDPSFREKANRKKREYIKKRRADPSFREKERATEKRERQKYPEKQYARKAARHVETKEGFHRHHWSYKKEHRTDIIYLSIAEHNTLHKYLVYDQEHLQYRTKEGVLLDTKQKHLDHWGRVQNICEILEKNI